MIKRVDIVSIPVADQAKAKKFYVDVLGFSAIRDNPMGPDQRWVQVRPNEGETSFTLVTWFDDMPAGSLRGIVLNVDSAEKARKELTARGLDASPIKDEFWGRYFSFADPDGNGFVVQEAKPGM